MPALLSELTAFLRGVSQSPRSEAAILLAHVLDCDRADLIAYPERPIHEAEARTVLGLAARRARHEPVAYLLGRREFYGRDFFVSPEVLIPRPETEELVELVLAQLGPGPGTILDLGCGSGCIGLTLALERPDLEVDLTDIDPQVLNVARRNRDRLCPGDPGASPRLHCSNWFAALPAGQFLAIVSNPPYVHPDESPSLAADVREYEPQRALFHPDPAGLYRQLLRESRDRLAENGLIAFETSPRWAAGVLSDARALGYAGEVLQDLAGAQRFVLARSAKK